jgi:hypothetical protein
MSPVCHEPIVARVSLSVGREAAIDDPIEPLHRFVPGMMRQHPSASGLRQSLPFVSVSENMQYRLSIICGTGTNDKMLAI